MRQVPIHNLRPNEREWTPPHLVFLDTETRAAADPDGETHTLRLWCLRSVDRRPPKHGKQRDEWRDGDTRNQLAFTVDDLTLGRKCTWLYAHNLAFDLAVTVLPDHLARRGWTVTGSALGDKVCWLIMHKADRSITLCDSWSWLPVALDKVAETGRYRKPPLPADNGSRDVWLDRCRADVAILSDAILDLMTWWDRRKLGNWTKTGAGCGWNAYRHHRSTTKVVIDPAPDVVAEDRRAVYGGRRTVWSVAQHAAGPFLEIDITAAYPSVAAHLYLPKQRRARFDRLDLDDKLIGGELFQAAAWALIDTDTPGPPCRTAGRVWYPVGSWWAYLAGPDLAEAVRHGQVARIGPGRVHQCGMSMMGWARDVLTWSKPGARGVPPVATLAAKLWGRAVIGKWAAHGYETTRYGPAPGPGWGHIEAWDAARGCRAVVQDVAGVRTRVTSGGDPDNAYPAVWAWVEAEVRVRLARMIDILGPGAVLSCNTDGLIAAQRLIGTTAAGAAETPPDGLTGAAAVGWCLDRVNTAIRPLRARVKASHETVEIRGPQHVKLGAQRHLSGVPDYAAQTGPSDYEFLTWPKMTGVMARGLDGTYRRERRRVKLVGPWPSGWLLHDGAVLPPEVRPGPDFTAELVPWFQTRYANRGLVLADVQRPELDKVRY